MTPPIFHDGRLWQQDAFGRWLRWDESRRSWQPFEPRPTPSAVPATYRDLSGPSRAFLVFLAAAVLAHLLAIVWAVRTYSFVDRLQRGDRGPADVATGTAIDRMGQLVGWTQIGIAIACAVAFIVWFHRGYQNLPALGVPDRRYGAGWAIGGWFVPFLAYFRPKQIYDDIWRATEPGLGWPAHRAQWGQVRVPAMVQLWWSAWIVDSVLGNISFREYLAAESLDELGRAAVISMVSDIASIVAAILVVPVVRAVTARQRARAQQRGGGRPWPSVT